MRCNLQTATCTVTYLAHLYASWESSHNQNTKGVIRRYFPKRRGLTTDGKHQIKHAIRKLNIGLKEKPGPTDGYKLFINAKTTLVVAHQS